MSDGTTVEHVTCLGCGCTCDDIAVVVRAGRIAEARGACALGTSWFGDGIVPAAAALSGAPASLDAAVDAAAALLGAARRVLVYLSTDVSCETQRAAVAAADLLHASVDGVGSAAARGVLSAQRRGRATATLGEIRNRADLLVFWGIDPTGRYPRFASRYAPEPAGLFVPEGRRSRVVVAVDVGGERGIATADERIAIAAAEELDAVAALRAALAGRTIEGPLAARMAPLAERIRTARYGAVVYDAEPGTRDRGEVAEGLIAMVQGANAQTRCSLVALRGGGNRNGADAVLTWQTGFPMTVDFSRGAPRYRPDDGAAALLAAGAVDTVLVVGDPGGAAALRAGAARRVLVGPRATLVAPPATVAIDTAVAGIHEAGTAFRMDDIPLPLRAPLSGPPAAADVLGKLVSRLAARTEGRA